MNPTTGVTPSGMGTPGQAPAPVPLGDQDRAVRDVLPALVRQVPVGVAVIRRDRTIAYHNDEFGRLLRLAPDGDGPAAKLDRVVDPEGRAYPAGDEPVERLFREGAPQLRQGVGLIRQDGGLVHASVTLTPIVRRSGAIVSAVLYVEDQSEDLDEVSLREAFVGVLSHELRTPITSIYGGTQLLLNDRMPAEIRTSVISDIAAEAEQLHRLVEDLLVIARVERGVAATVAEPVLVQHLATQAAAAEERRWPGHRVEVHADVDLPAVRADDGFVSQILRNLISNAVKYSQMEEPVVVTVTAEGDEVAVSVLDRGPGFPADTGADAFRLFYRSPSVAARVAGTGIGLFVARALVEAQGGRIWLRNRPNGGAEVGFALPCYPLDDAG